MRETIGPYQIEAPIGAGGMGQVFAARHVELGRPVALKLLPPNPRDERYLARFMQEMKLASRLSHPNLIRIYDGGIIETTPFIAMELVSGESLQEVVSRGRPLPWRLASAIVRDVAGALALLHEHGIIHRDLKPS